jgi:hypothetical protein
MRDVSLIAAASIGATVVMMTPVAYADQGNGVIEEMQQLAQTSDPQDFKNAQIDVEYDAAECAAYYNLEAALTTESGYGNTDTGRGMSQAAQVAMQFAFEMSTMVGMSEDALKALLKLDTTEIVGQLGKDSVNAPLVLQTVGMPCKALLEDPMARMAYWVKIERDKHVHSAGR